MTSSLAAGAMRRADSRVLRVTSAYVSGSTPWSLREPKKTTSSSSGCTTRPVRSAKTLPWSPRTPYPARPSAATSALTRTPSRFRIRQAMDVQDLAPRPPSLVPVVYESLTTATWFSPDPE
ncbi:Uncharacterised protein [Mycobacteroides abscessus subsp. abscessus]|nr:Uncharacterised protein [Mycobacteroides abscessus subsp. abscessus]SKT99504.1 Uncharacterised protein [Mycobacteroides abscessus subsp. abscessus]